MSATQQLRLNGICLLRQLLHGHWTRARFHWAGIRRALLSVSPTT